MNTLIIKATIIVSGFVISSIGFAEIEYSHGEYWEQAVVPPNEMSHQYGTYYQERDTWYGRNEGNSRPSSPFLTYGPYIDFHGEGTLEVSLWIELRCGFSRIDYGDKPMVEMDLVAISGIENKTVKLRPTYSIHKGDFFFDYYNPLGGMNPSSVDPWNYEDTYRYISVRAKDPQGIEFRIHSLRDGCKIYHHNVIFRFNYDH